MALIQCPDCGKMISDSAANCPNCGYPLREKTEEQFEKQTKKKNNRKFFIRLLEFFILIVAITAFLVAKNVGGNSQNLSFSDAAILLNGIAWIFLPILIIAAILILLLKK